MWADLRSFRRYQKRFWTRYVADGLSWGHNNVLWGFVGGFLVFLWQWKHGTIAPVDANAQFLALVAPYLWGFGVWAVVQLFVTSWKLDREREKTLGLPLELWARFGELPGEDADLLTLRVTNRGHNDKFMATVYPVEGEGNSILEHLPARWRMETERAVEMLAGDVKYIDLARVEKAKRTQDGESIVPPLVVYVAGNSEREVRHCFKKGGTVQIGVTITSQTTYVQSAITVLVGMGDVERLVAFYPMNVIHARP